MTQIRNISKIKNSTDKFKNTMDDAEHKSSKLENIK